MKQPYTKQDLINIATSTCSDTFAEGELVTSGVSIIPTYKDGKYKFFVSFEVTQNGLEGNGGVSITPTGGINITLG